MDHDEPGGSAELPRTRKSEPQNSADFDPVAEALDDALDAFDRGEDIDRGEDEGGLGDDDGGDGDGPAASSGAAMDDSASVGDDDGGDDPGGRPPAPGNVVSLTAWRNRPPEPQAGDPGPGGSEGGGEGKADGAKKKRSAIDIAASALKAEHLVTDDAGGVYQWNGRFWAALTPTGVKALAHRHGARTRDWRNEVVDFWKSDTHKPGRIWGRVEGNEVALENGVLDILTHKVREHRPDDYLERIIPHHWDPAAKCPTWMDCLDMWFGSIECDQVVALQEFVGYVLTQHARYKKALLLIGPTGTGKSRLVELLEILVGKDRRCTVSVEDMDDPVLVAPIQGAALNVVTELPTGALIRDGAFKKLVSTEEPILINRKYLDVATYVPTAKHVIATNTLPAVSDRSEATFARMLLLRMDRPPPKDKRLSAGELDARLSAEAPGIIRWAVDGLRRLYQAQGEFSAPASTAALMEEYRREQNPIVQFVEERCEPDRTARITTLKFQREFNRSGLVQHQWSQNRTTRTLKDLNLPGVEVKGARFGKRVVQCVHGLRLLPEIEVADDGSPVDPTAPPADATEF